MSTDQINPVPDMGSALNTADLMVLGTMDDKMIILLDIALLMYSSGSGLLEPLAA